MYYSLNDIKSNGGKGIITSNKHKTGTDRIFEAYEKLNIKNIDYILNLQGDEPVIDSKDIINLNNLIINENLEMGTLACKILDNKNYHYPNLQFLKIIL